MRKPITEPGPIFSGEIGPGLLDVMISKIEETGHYRGRMFRATFEGFPEWPSDDVNPDSLWFFEDVEDILNQVSGMDDTGTQLYFGRKPMTNVWGFWPICTVETQTIQPEFREGAD